MKPSLNNAYARTSRAKQHLTRLKREASKFWRSFHPPKAYIDPEVGGTITIDWSRRLIPPVFGILVGETIYNLRAALDYLVYELAILDSGQVQENTQFPIKDTEQGWQTSMSGRKQRNIPDYGCQLRGLSPIHKACIKLLQPQYGCDWTGVLRDFSNPDKHRTLTIVRATEILSVEPTAKGPVILSQGKTILFDVRINPRGNAVDMNADISFQIAFDDRRPVIETLQVLHSQVTQVLDQFKPEFE